MRSSSVASKRVASKSTIQIPIVLAAVVLSILKFVPEPIFASTPDSTITQSDVNTIVKQYNSPEALAQMVEWKKLIIHPDATYRQAVLKNLPASYEKFLNRDEKLRTKLNTILNRGLTPYNKEYTLIILNHSGPQIMNESYAALTITTGLLKRIPSDDALLLFVYHEMSHDFFAEESLRLKNQLEILIAQGKSKSEDARTLIKQLMLIELKCDAAATRIAVDAGQNPKQYIKLIESIYKEFPDKTSRGGLFGFNIHPAPTLRRQLVEAIAGPEALARRPNVSDELKTIKSILSLERLTMVSSLESGQN